MRYNKATHVLAVTTVIMNALHNTCSYHYIRTVPVPQLLMLLRLLFATVTRRPKKNLLLTAALTLFKSKKAVSVPLNTINSNSSSPIVSFVNI